MRGFQPHRRGSGIGTLASLEQDQFAHDVGRRTPRQRRNVADALQIGAVTGSTGWRRANPICCNARATRDAAERNVSDKAGTLIAQVEKRLIVGYLDDAFTDGLVCVVLVGGKREFVPVRPGTLAVSTTRLAG